ncbi:IS1182 family transposase [Saccharopolyspora pogona]|uniref:IS1182 family transposase n=1 Tax=Saccharopolyspora pogona TaxID=333966 RepID=UPI001CC23239|nr:IS1182 family transposase [Saccharopolyspora pogona]
MSVRRMEFVVSVQPRPWPKPVPEIAAAIRAMYSGRRELPLAVRVRDQLGELFSDAEFAAAFGIRGKPGFSPGLLAMITVLQKAENLTDRQAADEVRTNLAWKYALGLELTDAGFDHTVLSEFRTRVVEHGLEEKVLDLLLAALRDKGLIAAGGKQRTDSTHVIAAVRDMNRLELAGEAVRACLESVSAAAPDWVAEVLDVPGWSRRYQQRIDTWRLPASQTKKDELALAYGKDGFTLLTALYAPASPNWLRELPAVEVLRVVLVQNYTRTVARNGREVVKRRETDTDGLPPGRWRLTSPYDTDARWGVKRDTFWNGYKVHISETCRAPESAGAATAPGHRPGAAPRPNLITNVATTDATVPDSAMLPPIHQALRKRDLLPDEHYLDSGYPSAELIVGSLDAFGIALITPVLLDHSRQARAEQGFAASDVTIDWQAQQVPCPAGQTSSSWTPCVQYGSARTVVTFSKAVCGPCPVRTRCTTAKNGRRQISLHPREMTEALRSARAEQQTKDWRRDYALRAGVKGTIRQATAVTGLRRTRYPGSGQDPSRTRLLRRRTQPDPP